MAAKSRDLLLFVFLRGGCDALTLFPPYGDAGLYRHRPDLAIQPPGSTGGAIDLDGFFGLAPSAAPLRDMFRNGHLAVVQAVGSPHPSRSHFEAMVRVETADVDPATSPGTTGWLGRYLQHSSPMGQGILRGLAIDPVMPRTLAGAPATLPIYTLETFGFHGHPNSQQPRAAALSAMFGSTEPVLAAAAHQSLATVNLLDGIDLVNYQPSNGAAYPGSLFGGRLRNAAALLKANIDLEVMEIDYGAWDHHDDQGPRSGVMAQMLDDFSRGLEAFYTDVLAELNRVTVVVLSEFGRRVDQNGSRGSDHGRGGAMLVMGGNVRGGQIYGPWPGLDRNQLDDFAVPVRTDYRDVLWEVLERRLLATRLSAVFPGFQPQRLGIVN